MASTHSWENRSGHHKWAVLDDTELKSLWGECSDDEFEETEETPGSELVTLLLDHMVHGRLSCQQCSELMFWAEKSGIKEAAPFSLKPGSSSGHAAHKLRKALGYLNSTDLYDATVPGHSRHDLDRTLHTVPILPFHEQVAESFDKDVGLLTKLQELKAAGDLPPVYTDHPVVREHPGEPVIPIAIFIDAVPYSQTDSVLGCWCLNVVTGIRFLWAVFRKRHMCQCGCRGWCTFNVIFRLAAWSIMALADKAWPSERHDGSPFCDSDSARAKKAGTPFMWRCACIYLKGDWAEYTHTFGFPAWNDSIRACFACAGCGPDMFVHAGNTPESLRWSCNEQGSYDEACNRCEVKVEVRTEPEQHKLVTNLAWDKRAKGGRRLVKDVPEKGLRVGDRLEPSGGLVDIGALESVPLPVFLVFWRPSEESIARHRNPLFANEKLGVTAEKSMTVDTLHAFYLGVMLVWCRVCLWVLLKSGVYGPGATSPTGLPSCCLAMRAALFTWFKAHGRSQKLTEINDWTTSMVGDANTPKCKTKASETWTLLLFLMYELAKFGQRVGPDCHRLAMAGECLRSIVFAWRGCGWNVKAGVVQVVLITDRPV